MPYREPSPPPVDEVALERLTRQRGALRRWRFGLALAALVLPSLLFLVFERQARRLEALAEHGVRVEATVTSSTSRYTDYAYTVNGVVYRWSVGRAEAPYQRGETLPVRVLPERPSVSRPGTMGDGAAAEARKNRAFFPKVLLGMALIFAAFSLHAHRQLERLERGQAPPRPRSPRTIARFSAGLVLALVLAVNLYDDVHAVQVAAFGDRPFGWPVTFVVCAAQVLLFLPYFWILGHFAEIVAQARRDGASLSIVGLVAYALGIERVHPHLVRSRTIAALGLAYFGVLVSVWIAYAEHLGI